MKKHKFTFWAAGGAMLLASSILQAQDLVADDLLTNRTAASGWQDCDGSTVTTDTVDGFDPGHLESEGCAYRETAAVAGEQYKFTCGVSSFKFSSLTLAFLDADDNTLATQSTEIFENVNGGAYSVVLTAPAGTVTAAVGIYGLEGSGFQDCTLLLDNPDPGPQDGSISGFAWFDRNEDSQRDNLEPIIPSTPVSILLDGVVIGQVETGLDGEYYFGGLDLGQCYQLQFEAADPSIQLTAAGGDNDAGATGTTQDVCLTVTAPNVIDVDAGYVQVPIVVPPEDYAVCGLIWQVADGVVADAPVIVLPNVTVKLTNVATGEAFKTVSSKAGRYSFNDLPAGDYTLQFETLSGYTFMDGDASLTPDGSFAGPDGMTPQFNLPGDSNTNDLAACTIRDANAGLVKTPVALDPTIANDDVGTGTVGELLTVGILGNDEPCDGSVLEVDLLGHNVPGEVTYNAATGSFVIANTTEAGTYSIEYGLRGACGSYDTATVTITLEEVVPPPVGPNPPSICQASIGKLTGTEDGVHVDIKYAQGETFADLSPQYNFYDADMTLVYTGIVAEAGKPVWGVYWRKREHGLEVLNIAFATAVENGVESTKTVCVQQTVTPIALDVDNSGAVESISGNFSFDMTGDGTDERLMKWFSPTDGVLIIKDFGNEISGEHLFGDVGGQYADGFAKLALEDVNADGQVSGDELQNLAIWTDRNSNTSVDAGEISTLASHGIESLATEHYKFSARAALANGKTMLMRDMWFPINPIQQASK